MVAREEIVATALGPARLERFDGAARFAELPARRAAGLPANACPAFTTES